MEAWVAEKLSEDSAILKERRKGREERALALGQSFPGAEEGKGGGRGGGGGGGGGGRGNKKKNGGAEAGAGQA